jgi:hypothetical protein
VGTVCSLWRVATIAPGHLQLEKVKTICVSNLFFAIREERAIGGPVSRFHKHLLCYMVL